MKTRFFALAMLALALVACNNDNENLNGDPVAAQFTADIAPATRASTAEIASTRWNGLSLLISTIPNAMSFQIIFLFIA